MSDEFNPNRNDEPIKSQEPEVTPSEPAYHFWAEQVSSNQPASNEYQNTQTYYTQYNQPNEGGYRIPNYQSYQGTPPNQNVFSNQNIPPNQEIPPSQNVLPNQDIPPNQTYYHQIPGGSMPQQPLRGMKNRKSSGKFKKGCKFVASSAIFGLVAAAVFIGANELYYAFNPDARPSTVKSASAFNQNNFSLDQPNDPGKRLSYTATGENTQIISTDVSEVVEDVMPSIVTITCTKLQQSWYGQYEAEGGGTGIIIDETKDELLIATNNHVVEETQKILVTLDDGSEYEATVKGSDAAADLAVISIKISDLTEKSKQNYKVATLGSSDDVKVGQMAIAIGNALGYGQSTTVGYISAKDREVTVDSSTKMTLLQTDAAINPGNSGGALLNIDGEVIGINTVKYAANQVEGMGFAIPISKAIDILDDLKTREQLNENEKGYLNITIKAISEEESAMYNWPLGILIMEVGEDGAADKAGILPRDIVTAVNGATVTNEIQLQEKVNSFRHGTTVQLTVQRFENGEYKELTFDVTLQQSPQLSSSENAKDSKTPEIPEPTQTPEVPESESPFEGFFNLPSDPFGQ